MSVIVKNDDLKGSIMAGQNAMDTKMLVDSVTILQQHYPHHFWHAMMYADKTSIAIRALNVSDQIGYILHTYRVQGDPELKCVIRAGGEILERAGLERGKCIEDSTGFDTTNSANQLDAKFHNNKNLQILI
jgi:hypothetical protein